MGSQSPTGRRAMRRRRSLTRLAGVCGLLFVVAFVPVDWLMPGFDDAVGDGDASSSSSSSTSSHSWQYDPSGGGGGGGGHATKSANAAAHGSASVAPGDTSGVGVGVGVGGGGVAGHDGSGDDHHHLAPPHHHHRHHHFIGEEVGSWVMQGVDRFVRHRRRGAMDDGDDGDDGEEGEDTTTTRATDGDGDTSGGGGGGTGVGGGGDESPSDDNSDGLEENAAADAEDTGGDGNDEDHRQEEKQRQQRQQQTVSTNAFAREMAKGGAVREGDVLHSVVSDMVGGVCVWGGGRERLCVRIPERCRIHSFIHSCNRASVVTRQLLTDRLRGLKDKSSAVTHRC